MAYSMLGHKQIQMDSYNKNRPQAHGTLIANWFQERVHRDEKGNGRAITKTHLPKKHELLHSSDSFNSQQVQDDDTKYRVLGDTSYGIGRSENYHYGKGSNKADTLPKTGRKQQLIQQMYLQQVTTSIEEQEKRKAEEAQKGIFETTSRTTFVPKPLEGTVVGRLIMYDQNWRVVDRDSCDQDMRESLGFKERSQITSDEELRKLIDSTLSLEKQQPITFWKQKLDEKTFYLSKPTEAQPFGKDNEFLKTFQHYKHYRD